MWYYLSMKTFFRLHAIAAGAVGLALIGCGETPSASETSSAAETPAPVVEPDDSGVTRDFVAVTLTGDEITGASIRGHVTIVDFWAVF